LGVLSFHNILFIYFCSAIGKWCSLINPSLFSQNTFVVYETNFMYSIKQNLLDLLQKKSMDVIKIGVHSSYPIKSMLIMNVATTTILASYPLYFIVENIHVNPPIDVEPSS
jgi:hypothetical protein